MVVRGPLRFKKFDSSLASYPYVSCECVKKLVDECNSLSYKLIFITIFIVQYAFI